VKVRERKKKEETREEMKEEKRKQKKKNRRAMPEHHAARRCVPVPSAGRCSSLVTHGPFLSNGEVAGVTVKFLVLFCPGSDACQSSRALRQRAKSGKEIG
jgi:hypothetical protein